jgi:hypothetical protein
VLEMRWPEFDRLCKAKGWKTDAEIARNLGISEQGLNHMRRGRTSPGLKVVDGCISVWGSAIYDVLFNRTEDAA